MMQAICYSIVIEGEQSSNPQEIKKMKVVNMQTEDYKKYMFTEQTNGSWLLTWEDCGEEVSEMFTEEEKKEIVIGWLRSGHVNF